jgi:amino acid adenylation domain-containing protein
MSIGELLVKLKDAQISLAVDGESLVVKAEEGLVTAEIKRELLKNKEELIAILKSDRFIGLNGRGEGPIPGNVIGPGSTVITPEMLPLIDLTQEDIDRIVGRVPGGIANIQDIYALSPLQDGILFHHLLVNEGDPYLMSSQMAFPNKALLDRFLSAVQQVIDRHDILRTAFIWEGLSQPAQVVWRQAQLSITEVQLDPQEGPIAEQLARRFDPRRHRIDLTQAPLFCYNIAREPGSTRWLVLQLQHHIIEDAVSVQIFRAEVNAFLTGQGHTLAPPQPFRNLVAQARLGVSREEHERFFRQMLGEVTEPTLPFGLGNVHQDGRDIAESRRMLPQALNVRLRAQARRLGVSLASLCHLAWGQVLARSSGYERVVFGTVLFGRMQAGEGADQAAGLFINTLPLRLDLDGSGAEDAVRQAHARLAELLTHEHASLALAQRCSGVAAPSPLFSAILNYRYTQMPAAVEDDVENTHPLAGVEFLGSKARNNYPLTMSVEDFGQALGLTVLAMQPLLSERVCGYMERALESLVLALETAPSTPVRELEILPPEERRLLLEIWNATETPYPDQMCIHQLFEEQARKTPEAVAVLYEDQSLSYGELNRQANRLAHHLIGLGVKPDDRVAICVERSLGMVIGLLGILKAGGAYVPLDPVYSSRRLGQILNDAAPSIVLSAAAGREALGEEALKERIVLDLDPLGQVGGLPPVWADQSAADPDPKELGLTSHRLAYVIYTSGSTGTPKGVMVEHRSVTNFKWALVESIYHPVSSQLRIGWDASFSFDMSIKGFSQLLSGHCLVVIPQHVRASGSAMLAFLQQEAIDAFDTTPSQVKIMIAEGLFEERINKQWTVLLGGELVDTSMWLQLKSCNSIKFYNMYGPTECTVDATIGAIRAEDEVPHIGRSIVNMRIYLLDGNGHPAPLGVAGEIHIGGAGVARGYLNRPELTAERFLQDPFTTEIGARMYKTGDLARYLPDGNIEFLGRNDHQVKIRGFRIELGEIEARLAEHPLVREAVVLAREDTPGEKRLVAYVISAKAEEREDDAPQGSAVAQAELAGTLRGHLAARLPEYMVPAAFVRLEALPLTPNGKLDRKALPAPEGDAYVRRTYEAPQGEMEQTLAGLWQDLLGVERVGRYDHFFELGGHSLLAIQLIERLRRLNLQIDIRALFATPTLNELALKINELEEVYL